MRKASWTLLLLLFGFPGVFAQQVSDLGAELAAGNVGFVGLHGNDGSSGLAIEGEIQNYTEVEIHISVNLDDPLYLGNQGAGQNMVATGIFEFEGGYYVEDSDRYIILMPGELLGVKLMAYCADFDKDNPASSDAFVVSALPSEIAAVAAKIARYQPADPDDALVTPSQLALWLAQGHSAEEISGKFEFSPEDESIARDILAQP